MHKKILVSLNRTDYQCSECASKCQVRSISFENQTNSFLLMCDQVQQIFEQKQRSMKDVIGDIHCFGRYCFNNGYNRQKCEFSVNTPRSIRSSGTYGAVSQSKTHDKRAHEDIKHRWNTIPFCQHDESRLRKGKLISCFRKNCCLTQSSEPGPKMAVI